MADPTITVKTVTVEEENNGAAHSRRSAVKHHEVFTLQQAVERFGKHRLAEALRETADSLDPPKKR